MEWTDLLLLAQTATSTGSSGGMAGGEGWFGAGLLGLVLGWLLLRHLPAKDAQIRELILDHATIEKDQRERHSALEREQRAEYRLTLDTVLEHNRKLVEGLGVAIKTDLQALQQAVEDLTKIIEEKVA